VRVLWRRNNELFFRTPPVVRVLGVFHGGQDWETALGEEEQDDPEIGG
jgi:hypothetical protein